ncbi:flavoprotein-like protein [Umbelopsis sp. PMI_123]|nr:flavoprotein-like protein [Umbelopsis sp. PMI_123]
MSSPVIYIVYYSTYGHIYTLAKEVQKGLEGQGVQVKIFQVPETLTEEVLTKMHAPPKQDVPVITVDDLKNADAILWGIPTRFGTMPAQVKDFLDQTGSLWQTGGLAGKFTGVFFSTASQHGGQETTAFTTLTFFAHHGMIYVPLGFAHANMFDNSEVIGSSPYGSGTVANGDGSRMPSEKELVIAYTQGENFAKIVKTMKQGATILEKANLDNASEDTRAGSAPTYAEAEPVKPEKTNIPEVKKEVTRKSEPKKEEKTKWWKKLLCM